jgi:uncharacterized protein YgiM (DUF1202 family)
MRGLITQALILCALLGASLAAQAAFITDKLEVEVYSQRFNQGTVLKKLAGGSSVEVLMADGQYSRIRTSDNITGWIETRYLSNEKPLQLQYLELLAKNHTLEADLKAAQEQLAAAAATPPANPDNGLSDEEIADLQQRAKDAGWMRVELKKARDRVAQLEADMKGKSQSSADSQQELSKLRSANKELEERLAAALLINKQQEPDTGKADATEPAATEAIKTATAASPADQHWSVNIEWFFGSLLVTLIVGIIAGMTWLDNRIRQRHGGFRIY